MRDWIREKLNDKEKENMEVSREKETVEVPETKEAAKPVSHKDPAEKTDDLQTRAVAQKPKTR